LTPNSSANDNSECNNKAADEDQPCTDAGGGGDNYIASRSRHPGGVNVSTCDGSVHFISDSIKLGVWKAMSSMDNGVNEPAVNF
jgi:prepilin-type processing-associated H-X9-DG protein